MSDANKIPPYKDSSVPLENRVKDLIGRMTLDEKISHLSSNMPGVERLGIPPFNWGGECLHGLCHTGRATVFPQAIGLAATFDPDLVEQVAAAISSEARAKHQSPAWKHGRPIGLTYWTPNINIFRDPRWGRGQETYGEDPYLTGLIGSAFVRGLQGNDPKYIKAAACAKHLAVHSGPESVRTRFNAVVSPKDLHETYLPAFKALVQAGVASVMATYNAVNGEPCCGSKTLLADILRGKFGFRGFVTSDAGAIDTMHKGHKFTKNAIESASVALRLGVDMDIGRIYTHLPEALRQGLVTEAEIDLSLSRLLTVLFKLGLFDDPEEVPYAKIGAEVIQCKKHISLTRKAAARSMVLLKNNGILPLSPDKKVIAVSGPNAADIDVLLGNFYRGVSADLKTVLEGIVAAAPEGTTVTYMKGCHLEHENAYPSTWADGLAEWADVIVTVMGISPLMEGEAGECIASPDGADRAALDLPANQVKFFHALKTKGKSIILILTGGSPVSVPELHDLADAVLFIWYPGEQGGLAVGDILFGRVSPSGRLPVTFPKSVEQLPPFEDYSMRGRTYRYMTEEPLYPFGFGLSYTGFKYGSMQLSKTKIKSGMSVTARVAVTNTGTRAADEVVQLYLAHSSDSKTGPFQALCGIKRIKIKPGQTRPVTFKITAEMMKRVDERGESILQAGTVTVIIGGSSPGSRSEALGAPRPAFGAFEILP